jgi:chitin synthase
VIWENGIYDLTDYFYTIEQNPNERPLLSWMNSTITDIWERMAGKDITKELNAALAAMPPLEAAKHNACLKNTFFVGETDFRVTARCQVQNYFLLAASIILVSTIAAKCESIYK